MRIPSQILISGAEVGFHDRLNMNFLLEYLLSSLPSKFPLLSSAYLFVFLDSREYTSGVKKSEKRKNGSPRLMSWS
jgi:hypothetical protein